MDSLKEGLNSPLAVVVILTLVAIMMREVFWFVKSLMKTTPTDKAQDVMTGVVSKLTETLNDISEGQKLMNEQMRHHMDLSLHQYEQLLHETRAIRAERSAP